MAQYKLIYLHIKGLGEPIRLVFALAGVKYEDIRIPYTPGQPIIMPPEIRSKAAYGQLPLLEFGDTILSQSIAITRFLGKKFNFYGKDDVEAAKIDELLEAVRDYRVLGLKSFWSAKTEEAKAEATKELIEMNTKYIEKFIEILKNNGTGYFVGNSVSLADIYVFYIVDYVRDIGKFDLKEKYGAIKEFYNNFANIPAISEWLEKRPSTVY